MSAQNYSAIELWTSAKAWAKLGMREKFLVAGVGGLFGPRVDRISIAIASE
jgi:hypothetical protein